MDQSRDFGGVAGTALVPVTNALNLVRDGLDVDLRLLPLLPKSSVGEGVLPAIFHNRRQVLAQVNGLLGEGDAAL